MHILISLTFQVALCTALAVKKYPSAISAQLENWNSNLAGKPEDSHSVKHNHKQTQKEKHGHEFGINSYRSEVCAPLTNVQGTHYTVNVNVGTPPQAFDLIADTGSSNLIVSSCDNWTSQFESPKCFVSNESSTLNIEQGKDGPLTNILTFGSGPIESMITSDFVGIDNLSSFLENGLFLMVDNLLDFPGPFEGIIGFGLPKTTLSEKNPELHHDITFLQKAGVNRFSMCYNYGNGDEDGGILRMNIPEMETTFGNIADHHWALNLEGITAGGLIAPRFCSLSNMPAGQKSPCGAIIDSGTTYILGPAEHIHSLYGDLCDQWPRCKKNLTNLEKTVEAARSAIGKISNAASWIINPVDKAMVFMSVLSDCNAWFDGKVGLDEIPSITVHLAGSGRILTLELEAWSFVVMQEADELKSIHDDIPGYGQVVVNYTKTGYKTLQCKPAFGAMDYVTEKNGPAWIFGLPIFYEYVINFDTSKNMPSLSFSKEPCGSCTKHEQRKSKLHKRSTSKARRPRRVHGEPRIPTTSPNLLF